MKVAVVMTVKNEARLLRQNLLYHLGIGIDRVFVYFDQTTDEGKETIEDLKNVVVQNSVSSRKYQNKEFLKKFWGNADEHHTARQCLNTYDAIQLCKQEGIDWLISLDADELFITGNAGEQPMTAFFNESVTKSYDIIQLPTLEVVNKKMAYTSVMAEETLFKKQKNFTSKFDQLYRKVYNPYAKQYITTSYWLGHTMGKTAINVQTDIIPYNVHRYVLHNGDKPKIKVAGNVLHYHLYDFEDFLKKYQNFKNRSNTYLSGNKINKLKSLWIKLVNDPANNITYLKDYYKKNIHYNEKEVARLYKTRLFNLLKRNEKAVVIITKPKDILNDIDSETK